jgi:hypothetical protein
MEVTGRARRRSQISVTGDCNGETDMLHCLLLAVPELLYGMMVESETLVEMTRTCS